MRRFWCGLILGCLVLGNAGAAQAQAMTYPKFSGDVALTGQNDGAFEQFLDQNEGKVVFLDLIFSVAFATRFNDDVYEMCSPYAEIWDNGLSGEIFTLPYTKDGRVLGEDEELVEQNTRCGDQRLTFVDDDLVMSSAGPGAHWYDIQGFYLVRRRADRFPYIELKGLEASAETWARVLGQ